MCASAYEKNFLLCLNMRVASTLLAQRFALIALQIVRAANTLLAQRSTITALQIEVEKYLTK